MVNEQVSDIVAQSAYDQIAQLVKDVNAASKVITDASKAARGAFDNVYDVKTLADLNAFTKAVNDSNKSMVSGTQAYTDAESKLTDVTAKLITIQAELGKSVGQNAQQLAKSRQELEYVNSQLAANTKALKEGTGSFDQNSAAVAKYTLRQQELKVEISATTQAMKTEIKEVMAASGSMDEMSQTLFQLKEQYRALSAEQRENANVGGVLQSKITILDEEIKALDVSIGNHQRLVGSYAKALADAGLNAQNLTVKLAELKAAGQEDTAAFQQMNVELDMWNNKIAKYSLSNGASTIGSTTFSPTFQGQLKAVKADMYALAEAGKMNTAEFRALSAQAQQLAASIKEVEAAMTTQTAAIDRYSNRFTSLFERMGIRMVFHLIAFQGIMTAFSALWDWFTKLTDAEQRATDKLDAYNSALKETAKLSGQIESQIAGGIAFDGSKAQIALKIANDQTKSIRERILAYQDLQSIMPNIFQSLTDEQKKTGEFTADMDKANTAIRLQNELKAANDVLESKSKALAISRGTLGQFEKNYIDSQDPNNSKNFNPTKYKNEFINAQLEQVKLVKELDAAQKNYNTTYENYNSLKIIDDKAKKEKTAHDNTLKNENELTKLQYEEYAKRLQIEAEGQKAISEDESKSLAERLTAYRQYQELTFQAQAEGLSAQYSEADASLKAIADIEKKSADKRTQQDKELLAKKSIFQQQLNTISAQYDLLREQNIDKTAKGIVAIQDDEVKKRIEALKYLENNNNILQNKELNALADQLKNKEIDVTQYEAKVLATKEKYAEKTHDESIAYLRAELADLEKQGVNITAISDALDKVLSAKRDATNTKILSDAKKVEEMKKEIEAKAGELFTASVDAAKTAIDARYQKELDYQQKILDGIEATKQAELDQVNNSLASDQKKAQQSAQINAKALADEKRVHDEINKIKRQQAIADRVAALLNIAEQEAIGQISAVKLLSDPVTAPFYPALAALIAGIGVAQTAAVLTTPLTAYDLGTDDHPGGQALVGEAGIEKIIEPGKEPYFVSKPTIMDLAAHTQVIPQKDLIAAQLGFLTPGLIQQINLNNDFTKLEGTIRDEMGATRQAIRNMPQTQYIATRWGAQKTVVTGGNRTNFINKNI